MSRESDEFDFFVSYARADNAHGWITRFVEELLVEYRKFSGGRKLTYFFDKREIGSFDDWQHRLHHGLAKSRLFLAFISPSYFASEWCRKEWKAWIDTEIAKHILSGGAAAIYFVEVPGFVGKVDGLREQSMLDEHEVARQVAELCRLPEPRDDFITASAPVVRQMRDRRQITSDFVQPFQQQGIDALRRDDLRRVLERLARDLDERSERVRLAADSLSTVPPYNKRFSGRLNELLDLRQRLKDDRAGVICGVHGLGGIGKTELAFTYAHAFASAYPGGRFLIPCDGKSSLRDAALHLGDLFRYQIGDEERKTAETYFAAIKSCLRERLDTLGHILLVLDNVSDLQVVAPQQTDLLTSLGPKLHLLATTRLLPPSGGAWLTLGELPEADALDLLEKHRPFESSHLAPRDEPSTHGVSRLHSERAAALRIVKRLGGFALAVELVAAWLATHPETTYEQFAEGLGLEDLEAIADSDDVELRRHNHQRRLSAVLGPVLAELRPAERRTLEYAACLPPDLVPLPWLQTLVTQDFPELSQHSRLSDPWSNLCRRLVRMGLLTRVEEEKTDQRLVRVHRLVQDLVRRKLSPDERASRQQAVKTLVAEWTNDFVNEGQWVDARWAVETLDALADIWNETDDPEALDLLTKVATAWMVLAEWIRADPLLRRVIQITEHRFDSNHPEVATSLSALALLFSRTNRLAETEPLLRRALSINEQFYGALHEELALDLGMLAQLLKDTNRLSEAEPLMRCALAIDEQSYGAEHPRVTIRLNNLAELLRVTNRVAEAEPLMRRHLVIFLDFTSRTGHEHPHLQEAFGNYADLLQAMGMNDAEVHERLNDLRGEYGMSRG